MVSIRRKFFFSSSLLDNLSNCNFNQIAKLEGIISFTFIQLQTTILCFSKNGWNDFCVFVVRVNPIYTPPSRLFAWRAFFPLRQRLYVNSWIWKCDGMLYSYVSNYNGWGAEVFSDCSLLGMVRISEQYVQ